MSYILQFIDSTRFMGSLSSNLANNISEVIQRIKCKSRHSDTNVKRVELNISIATVFLNTQILDNLIKIV